MKSRVNRVELFLCLLVVVVSSLCAASAWAATVVSGTVQSGGTRAVFPLPGAVVTLFEATETQPTRLRSAATDPLGHFSLTTPRVTSDSIFYVTANLGDGVQLVTILGKSLPAQITINELTTVAAAYSMAQFYKDGMISGEAFRLRIAADMNDNIVSPVTGESSEVLLSPPNGDQTNSLRSTRALANLLAACVDNHAMARVFFDVARPPRGAAPRTTPQALANVARNPEQQVRVIYSLTKVQQLYLPALEKMPHAWTVTVKVNDSGDDGVLIGGLAAAVFDAQGFAWITNNVVQGTTGSSNSVIVLKPNGRPADGTDGSPVSPVTGGGILGTGFGIDIDTQGSIWLGNFGWGGVDPSPGPDGNGSVSQFTPSGQPISTPNGYFGGTFKVQGLKSDAEGNIWIASFGNDRVCVFLGGDPNSSVCYQEETGSHPFDVAIAADGTAWATNEGDPGANVRSSVAKFALVDGALQRRFLVPLGKSLKGMSLDSLGNAWVASGGNSKVYGLRPNGRVFGAFNGGGVNGPWSVTVDSEDNLWVANFGPLSGNFTSGRISKLYGANRATRPPGKKTGDPISPPSGYTVPSAGSEVLLHNGEPLYGPGSPPSYSPLMRVTQAKVDRAGNVWSMNNWKPDFSIDVQSNPGGDGAVIFVGLAPPANR